MTVIKKPFENIVGIENAPFPTIFSIFPKANFSFLVTFILLSAFNLDQPKILLFGIEFTTDLIMR